jgi:hypothetical protein
MMGDVVLVFGIEEITEFFYYVMEGVGLFAEVEGEGLLGDGWGVGFGFFGVDFGAGGWADDREAGGGFEDGGFCDWGGGWGSGHHLLLLELCFEGL